MKHFKPMLCVAVVLCGGCSDSGRAPALSPPGATADFSTFVVSQFLSATPSETAAPVEVEGTTFTFADDDDPNIFDAVIATAP